MLSLITMWVLVVLIYISLKERGSGRGLGSCVLVCVRRLLRGNSDPGMMERRRKRVRWDRERGGVGGRGKERTSEGQEWRKERERLGEGREKDN